MIQDHHRFNKSIIYINELIISIKYTQVNTINIKTHGIYIQEEEIRENY